MRIELFVWLPSKQKIYPGIVFFLNYTKVKVKTKNYIANVVDNKSESNTENNKKKFIIVKKIL